MLASVCELSQKTFFPLPSESSLQVLGGNVPSKSFYFTLLRKSNSFQSWLLIGTLPLNIPLFSVSHGLQSFFFWGGGSLQSFICYNFDSVSPGSAAVFKMKVDLSTLLASLGSCICLFLLLRVSYSMHYHIEQKEKGFFFFLKENRVSLEEQLNKP